MTIAEQVWQQLDFLGKPSYSDVELLSGECNNNSRHWENLHFKLSVRVSDSLVSHKFTLKATNQSMGSYTQYIDTVDTLAESLKWAAIHYKILSGGVSF